MFTPYVGTTYKFVLKNEFAKFNDVYTVLGIMTYEEMLADNINLEDLYNAVGLTAIDLEKEIVAIREGRVYKLQFTSDRKSVIYIPEILLLYEPDPYVKEYHRLMVVMDLGIYNNMNDVNYVKSIIRDIFERALGVQQSPEVLSHSTIWLTEKEYLEIENQRAELKAGVVNLFSETIRLRKEVDRLQTVCNGYEKVIIKLQQGGLLQKEMIDDSRS